MKPSNALLKRRGQRGAAAVELALMTLPLVLMSMAAVEFSRVVYQYNIIVKATRDAARILTAFDPAIASDYPTALAKSRVVYSDDQGQNLRLQGLALGNVEICNHVNSAACAGSFSAVGTGSGPINLVRVQVSNFQFQPMFPAPAILPTLTFGPIGTTMKAVD